MEISAKWWSLLSDHIRTIKKSFSIQQPLIDDSHTPLDSIKPIVELQKPLQPSTLSNNTSSRTNSNRKPLDTPIGRNTDVQQKLAVPLPPRRAPTAPSSQTLDSGLPLINPLQSNSSSFTTQPQNSPASTYPDLSNNKNDPSKSDVPLALQMEMALHAAVEERKTTTISNPWGEDEDNVWG